MYLSEVREQNAEASNRMIDELLGDIEIPDAGVLRLWSDCGPHFRSAENLHHHLFQLCVKRKQTVNCSFLGEQHGKNMLDTAFGAVSRWLDEQALVTAIHNVQQLAGAIQRSAEADPRGPRWKCKLVDFGRYRQQTSQFVRSTEFKITRTYCLLAEPPASGRERPVLRNRVFSDLEQEHVPSCHYNVEEVQHEEAVEWKKSFFEGSKTWEEPPPDIGDTTVLCKRLKDQAHKPPRQGLRPMRTFAERAQARAKKTLKDGARLRRRLEALQGEPREEVPSSSSSSSSSTDSDSVANAE